MNPVKRVALTLATIAMGTLVLHSQVTAQVPAKDAPAGAAMVAATGTATVEAVDATKRLIVLKAPDGAMGTIHCGKDVVNFDQIQVGDQVHATVLDRVVVFVGKPGTPSVKDGLMIARAPKGAKPGVLICQTETINDKIESIDPATRTVTIEGTSGKPQTFKVAPDVDLSNVKAGEDLTMCCTRGLALMVEKPAGEAQPAAGKIKAGDAAAAIEAMTATATVTAVDASKRMVTLKAPSGETRTFHLGKECINFDQIKVGDVVRATLAEEVAVGITKPGMPADADAGALVARAAPGSKPGMIIADTADVAVKIEAIDAANHTLKVVPAGGKPRTIKVGPHVDLSGLQIGDDVTLRLTQALAIVVEAK